MLKSLLIANRGEIACRIIRTARKLGVTTVAVYSDADAGAPHVKLADKAVHIGPSPAAESYLVGEKIIAAAKDSGAEAIHPGYGFLSENADFAQSVIDASLIWVGPPPSAIRAMGLKDAAKKLMLAADVPVTPGYLGEDQSLKTLKKAAADIGYPVLIKAVAGGGGKGMRKVDKAGDFADALASCQREAKAAFGDDHVLLEKFVTDPRHIEVQVFGDSHGNVVHLFERDCTLQRRHQKVIEEAPAPGMDADTRDAVCMAAVRAAQAVDYVGAGTIEFIADGSEGLRADRIWFMEMNTRLQVEHPVTEMITGQDLVEWQLRVASGEPLPRQQDELSINGWAMEARLYAENPSTGFLPSTGKLDVLALPQDTRVDSGVEQGGDISPFYDPMIAKLIIHGDTRDDARLTLAKACDSVATYPVHNNAGFLSRLLRDPAFVSADVSTGHIDANLDRLTERPALTDAGRSAAARHLAKQLEQLGQDGPWSSLNGFRLSADADLETLVDVDGENQTACLTNSDRYPDLLMDVRGDVLLVEAGWPFLVGPPRHSSDGDDAAGDGAIRSPMPGRLISIEVADGDSVAKGQKLATLEAMKMEHALTAPFDGVVSDVAVKVDDQLVEGALILKIEAGDD